MVQVSDIEYRGEYIEIQWSESKWESNQLYSANGESSSKDKAKYYHKRRKIGLSGSETKLDCRTRPMAYLSQRQLCHPNEAGCLDRHELDQVGLE